GGGAVEPLGPAQGAREAHGRREAEAAHELAQRALAAAVVAGDLERDRLGQRRERAHEHVDLLARQELAEIEHAGRPVLRAGSGLSDTLELTPDDPVRQPT